MDELNNIISQKRALLARENISRPAISYDKDMPGSQKDRFIEYLIERDRERDLDMRARDLVMEDLMAKMKDIQKATETAQHTSEEFRKEVKEAHKEVRAVKSQNERLVKKLERKDQEIRKLKEQLKYARQNQFGDKRQKISKDKIRRSKTGRAGAAFSKERA